MGFLYSDQHIEDKMLELKENDLTNMILIPLFKSLHNGKIEFVGGAPEKGKDIVFTLENAYGEKEITAVQVKKIKPNANAASTNSMQNVITQLNQCKSEDIVLHDGTKRAVDHLFFITPHIINQRILDVHQGALYKAVQRKVRIWGGDQIIKLAKKSNNNLFDCLFEQAPAVSRNLEPLLTCDEVYRALNLSSRKNLCDIYCSVDTVIGNSSKNSLLNSVVTAKEKLVKRKVSLSEYVFFFNERLKLYRGFFNESFLDNEHVIEDKEIERQAYQHEINLANDLIIASKEAIKERVQDSAFKGRLKNINHPATYLKLYKDEVDRLKKLEVDGKLKIEDTEFKTFLELLQSDINQWNVNLITMTDAQEKARNNDLEIIIRTGSLCSKHSTLKEEIREAFSKREVTLCLSLLDQHKLITEILNKCDEFLIFKSIDEDNQLFLNLKFNIEDLIMSGKNILLLGEAGSGKTTNLKNFTKKKKDNIIENLIVFTSLAKLYKDFDEEKLSDKLISYIKSLGSNAERRKVQEHLNFKGTTIFLDSIDEAIPNHPSVVNDIANFSINFPSSQIITSSRFTIDEVSDLGFSQISLLKFSREQKNNFFSNWFHETPEKAELVMEHLDKNINLSEVVSNPLAATILASLCEKNVPLPTNEAQLYKKRFELLCGSFDDVKGIKRMKSDPDDLMNASQLIAFKLHQKKLRVISRTKAISVLEQAGFEPKGVTVEKIVDELIFPAEILNVDLDGNYDFGHLRYQEYLASKELQQQYSIVLKKIVCDTWWHDSLVLLSQDTRNIERFVFDAQSHGYVTKASILKKMLSNRSKQEQGKLNKIINTAISDERDFGTY